MIGRIVRSADFERVLRSYSPARSPHFAVHHLADVPTRPAWRRPKAAAAESLDERSLQGHCQPGDQVVPDLSTTAAPIACPAVDKSMSADASSSASALWLGAVVPKRHARRSVTRSLIKRQIRAAMQRRQTGCGVLQPGLWVVRLRAPFDKQQFPSAASDALKAAARSELDALLAQAAIRLSQRA